MLAHEELLALLDLQGQTIDRLHPSWLPDIAPEIGSVARISPAGRRWLANRLSKVTASLFSFSVSDRTALCGAGWLIGVLRNPLECALDLGSVALAANVRMVITRAGVSRLRAVLGAARYERVLSTPLPAPSDNAPAAPSTEAGVISGDITERLIRCGAYELATYSNSIHPAIGDSVKLSFECTWWDTAPDPLLAPEVAEACLRLRISLDGGAND